MRRFITILAAIALLLAGVAPAMAGGDGINFISSQPLEKAPPGFWTNERIQAALANPKEGVRLGFTPIYGSQAAPTTDPVRSEPGYNPDGDSPAAPGSTADYTPAASCPASSYEWYYDSAQQEFPERAVGKLLFVDGYGDECSCSASLVNRKVVLTAGHCVADYGLWHSHVIFIPGYLYGSEPYGRAYAVRLRTFSSWLHDGNFSRDVAFITLDREMGYSTGWLGFATGGERNRWWTQYGYPARDPYDGGILVVNTSGLGEDDCSDGSPCTMGVGSAHTNGSSGGPWVYYNDDNRYANGVNSYYYPDCTVTMYSPYFDSEVWDLYEAAKAD